MFFFILTLIAVALGLLTGLLSALWGVYLWFSVGLGVGALMFPLTIGNLMPSHDGVGYGVFLVLQTFFIAWNLFHHIFYHALFH